MCDRLESSYNFILKKKYKKKLDRVSIKQNNYVL